MSRAAQRTQFTSAEFPAIPPPPLSSPPGCKRLMVSLHSQAAAQHSRPMRGQTFASVVMAGDFMPYRYARSPPVSQHAAPARRQRRARLPLKISCRSSRRQRPAPLTTRLAMKLFFAIAQAVKGGNDARHFRHHATSIFRPRCVPE